MPTKYSTIEDIELEVSKENFQSPQLGDNEKRGLLSSKSQDGHGAGSTWYSGAAVLANAALGAGLLNLPQAFDKSGGIAVSLLVMALILFFIVTSLLLLAYFGKVTGCDSYQGAVTYMCGRTIGTICGGLVAFLCYGAKVTALIIIGDQWSKFFQDIYGDEYCLNWYMNRNFTITVSSIVLILPFCFFKRIDSLRHVSVIGAIAVAYITVMVIVKFFLGENSAAEVEYRHGPEVWTDAFYIVPVICFSYQCHVEVIPVYHCLKKQNMAEGSKSVIGAVIICIVTYTSTAIFGYLTFGTSVRSDILLNYEVDWPMLIGQILIAVKCYTAYPVLLFITRLAIDDLWKSGRGLSASEAEKSEKTRRFVIGTIIFISTIVLALLVPEIDIAIQIIGAFITFLIFIFPGMVLLQLTYIENYKQSTLRLFQITGVSFLIIGVFLFGLALSQNIIGMINAGHVASIRPENTPTAVCM